MSFLISGVFGDEMKVLATDDEGSMHFGRNDGSSQDTSTNGHFTGERTFFVCQTRSAFTLVQLTYILPKVIWKDLVVHTYV